MRDTTDHNEKLKSVYNDMNTAPVDVSKPNSSSLGSTDSTTFSSEKNHTEVSQLTSMDKSEFDTTAKPL